MTLKGINWNETPFLDMEVWNRLTTNFWLPEKIPVSNDIKKWGVMTPEEKLATRKVFAGLTLLDTIQGTIGAPSMLKDADGPHEEAVLTNIAFMESVHAKSYSNIFMTLCSTEEINETFWWAETSDILQRKAAIIVRNYKETVPDPQEDAAYRKAASVMLESFMFYSGFYLPFKFASQGKLTNTADIIRLILRDEGVHGYYIGAKYQQHRAALTMEQREDLDYWVHSTLRHLYELECKFAEEIYDPLGWTEGVKVYLRYNANKTMHNMGYDSIFPDNSTRVEPAILSSMTVDANETHDFFSGAGSSYVMAKVEETDDDDWS